MKYWFIILLLFGCTPGNSRQTEVVPNTFDEKYQTYLSLLKDFSETNCDWLLFQSLTEAIRGTTGNIERAEGKPGQWFRTPEHDCYPERSASSISRDMLLGLAVYLWQTGNSQKDADEVVAYADNHDGDMGEGESANIGIRPVLYNTFKSIAAKFGEIPLPPKTLNPDVNSDGTGLTDIQQGFESHILVLHIFSRGLIYGELSTIEMRLLESQAERQPRNAFFQAVYHKFLDGDQTAAIKGLMDESLFPTESLPTNEQYCEPYLWQRDEGKDWEPCEEKKAHTGADFLVAATVVRNGFREGTNWH